MHITSKFRTTTIKKVVKETLDITTLYLNTNIKGIPGQYIMVWIPGIDEVPMSLSGMESDTSITVRVVGEATKALSELKTGSRIGVRGPYGNGYSIEGLRPLIVGGGSGIASLYPLVVDMEEKGLKPSFLIGAKSSNQLLFKKRLSRLLGSRLIISTDDGSEGYHGYASTLAEKMIRENSYDSIYTCGPEIMMSKIYETAEEKEIMIQISMERIFKCAVGICGSCAVGPYRTCKDGPIFDTKMLKVVQNEVGKSRMDESGKSIKVIH